jgi:hypothetical protein
VLLATVTNNPVFLLHICYSPLRPGAHRSRQSL